MNCMKDSVHQIPNAVVLSIIDDDWKGVGVDVKFGPGCHASGEFELGVGAFIDDKTHTHSLFASG